jgi:hypothetical protein
MTDWDDPAACARAMWLLFEPVHAVTYFAPQARAAYESAGLRGYWRGYFGGRAAPLGAVGASPVIAAFYGFAPQMVRRALPDIWSRAEPSAALAARLAGARAALAGLLDEAGIDAHAVERAAAPLRGAALSLDVLGRPLAAANADLPWPQDPLETLWHAATLLREHRGDGHVAALLVAGLDGCETLVWRAAMDNERAVLQPNRGWSDEEWQAAADRLAGRGLLDADGSATQAAFTVRTQVEATTDALAAGPWRALGAARSARLAEALAPLTAAASSVLPHPDPIGLRPRR